MRGRTHIRRAALVVLFTLPMSCHDDDDGSLCEGDCACTGADCVCPDTGDCEIDCEDDCDLSCTGSGDCDVTCHGDCTVACPGSGTCTLHCAGEGICEITECEGVDECDDLTSVCNGACP